MRRLIEPSHRNLCCLQKPIIIACGSERVNRICASSEDSDLHWTISVKVEKFLHADNEDSDQTAWMRMLTESSLGAHVRRYVLSGCGSTFLQTF